MTTTARGGRIVRRFIEEELRESFIDYSMSVIVQRALPDARDGLKPVHRRILYAMHELGLAPDRDHKKSATVVGDVLGKYHPHGDSAVYDALVRMVQDFSLRYPLIDGQGNFGSIDGDSAAAYRYTEARLAPLAGELLADIERETVEFVPNFDGRLEEPTVLPTRLPHLLLNGTDGIAVGMATKIPPHNMRELLEATVWLVRHPECAIEELMERVEGPDFPTGGYIWGWEGIGDAYRTGRGLVEMRARVHVEEGSYGKASLVVTELPYQVNKTRVIEQITRMVRSGRSDAVTDLRDESDRDGLRLVIEMKRDADRRKLLRTLFLKTQLRTTFGVIMLALVDGRPVQLDLKQALESFVDHRLEVIRRRASFELRRSEERAHVVEGLLTALDRIDEVIEWIRSSTTPQVAADRLCAELGLSERQAQAILAMRLASLTRLEGSKLEDELETLRKRIAELRRLVDEEEARRTVLCEELEELTARYGDDRRTVILDEAKPFPLPSAGGEAEASLVLLSRRGWIKAQPVRNGSGMAGAEALADREGDFVRQAFVARGSAQLLAFTAGGAVHGLAVKDLPRGTRSSRGQALDGLLELEEADRIVSLLPVTEFDAERTVLLVTRQGQVKRTPLEEYSNTRAGGIRAAGLVEGDEVLAAIVTDGDRDVLLATRAGMVIRFPESEVRPMGRSARGVKGVDLDAGDEVVAGLVPRRDAEMVAVTVGGYAKRLPLTEFRTQGRAGKGLSILPDRESTGDLAAFLEVEPADRIVVELAGRGAVETPTGDLPLRARRDPSRRLPAVGRRGSAVLGAHPLRAALAAEEVRETPEAGPPPRQAAGPVAQEPGPGVADGREADGDGDGDPGTSQGELDLSED